MTEHEWQSVAKTIRDAWPRCEFSQAEADTMKGMFIRHDAGLARRVIAQARRRHDTGTLAIGVMGDILRAELQQLAIDQQHKRRAAERDEAERNRLSLAELATRGGEVWESFSEAQQRRAREVMARSFARTMASRPAGSLFFMRAVAICDEAGMFKEVKRAD